MSEGKSTPEQIVPKAEARVESSLPPQPPKSEQRSKRRALLKGAIAFAATAGAALWGSKEIKAQKEGIETPNATYIPLYERHDKGLTAKDVPSDLDILVVEGGGNDEDLPGYGYLKSKKVMPIPGGGQKEFSLFQDGVLEKLAQNNTKVAFADIDNGVTLEEARELMKAPHIAAIAALLGTYTYTKGKAVLEEIKGEVPSSKELSRRHFIQKLGYTSAAILGSGMVSDVVMKLPIEDMGAVGRIITRLDGLQSNLHPEDLSVFIRNVFTADKIMAIAEQLNSEKNQKLRIGINYGSAHSGIEDFLRAGPEVCRVIIGMFPKEYLQHVIASNGSAENLASSAVIELPKDFKITDLVDRDKAMRIQTKKITDTRLSDKLQSIAKAA